MLVLLLKLYIIEKTAGLSFLAEKAKFCYCHPLFLFRSSGILKKWKRFGKCQNTPKVKLFQILHKLNDYYGFTILTRATDMKLNNIC